MTKTLIDYADRLILDALRGHRRRPRIPDRSLARWHAEGHARVYLEVALRLHGYRAQSEEPEMMTLSPLPTAAASGWLAAHDGAAERALWYLLAGPRSVLRKHIDAHRPDGDVYLGVTDTDRIAASAHYLWLYRVMGIKLRRPIVELTVEHVAKTGWAHLAPVFYDVDALSIARTAVKQDVLGRRLLARCEQMLDEYPDKAPPKRLHERVGYEVARRECDLGSWSPLDEFPWI